MMYVLRCEKTCPVRGENACDKISEVVCRKKS